MATRKKKERIASPISTQENLTIKAKQSLVFISHDTRDAEIAEAFSKLLSSVSAGVLKSFRSSDRKGTQGIEYGVEWFPEIMKKLDEASDIVCLLTQASVDRPWILYEAGVAKGKLGTTVLGIALGIPLHKASNGPFAQFQNCADDEDSLTKLVLQLVRKIPNAEPVEEVVKEQVKLFKNKLAILLDANSLYENLEKESKEDTSVAKLFEEIKIMFQDLPSRMQKRLAPESMMLRRKKNQPKMLDEYLHFSLKTHEPNISFLMAVSFFKDELPWFYELGIDTYRILKSAKTKAERIKIINGFHNVVEMIGNPIVFEIAGRTEYGYSRYEEMKNILHHYLDKLLSTWQ